MAPPLPTPTDMTPEGGAGPSQGSSKNDGSDPSSDGSTSDGTAPGGDGSIASGCQIGAATQVPGGFMLMISAGLLMMCRRRKKPLA
jgi:hypothetical protein